MGQMSSSDTSSPFSSIDSIGGSVDDPAIACKWCLAFLGDPAALGPSRWRRLDLRGCELESILIRG